MSLLKRLLEFFRTKEQRDETEPWNEFTLPQLLHKIKPKGNRAARRREWRGSWRDYQR